MLWLIHMCVSSFNRKDGSPGRVASVLLEDETGTVRLSLWDEDVELKNEMETGSLLAVENGYTRESLGSVGLNAGGNSQIKINPEDVEVGQIRQEDTAEHLHHLDGLGDVASPGPRLHLLSP